MRKVLFLGCALIASAPLAIGQEAQTLKERLSDKASDAEQIARRAVAAHTVLLRVGPAHAAPNVAVDVAAHSVGYARRKTVGEDLAVRQTARFDFTVEHPDMRGTSVGQSGVDDVKPFLIRRETDAVRLCEVIHHRLDLARLAVHAEGIVLILLLGLLEALVVAADAVGRIGEPDRAVG